MKVSFPTGDDGAIVRRMIVASAADDSLGMGTVFDGARYTFAYPAVVVVSRKLG
jgi:hypothetical protein